MKPLLILLLLTLPVSAKEQPNVLFIAVDDLRCELGCYGSTIAKSPNIDKLAETSVRFDRAYCQQAICGPSRASVMTGLRPDASQIHGNHSHFRDIHPDIVTLPQHFKNHGYHTRSMGKIYHGVFPKGSSITVPDTFGDKPSWSIPTFRPGPRYYYTEEGIEAAKQVYQKIYNPINPTPNDWTKKLVFGPATEAPDVADNVLYDGQVADRAVESLAEWSDSKEPFFLAVGFIKPHSPYIAPKKFWDLYDSEAIHLPTDESKETDAPSISLHGSGELRRYTDQKKKGSIPESDQRTVRHAYLACISYIDAQVGRVLTELEKQGLAGNTIVVLWSDHGYHLGEKNLWGKTTNFELDTRVPMMIRTPDSKAGVCKSPVELVDLYPTLSELAGLPVGEHLQGTSIVDTLKNPVSAGKIGAFSQYSRGKMRGYSVRTKTHRYTEWIDTGSGKIKERLLFDHTTDPEESKNRIGDASPTLVEELSQLLDHGEGWRKAGRSNLSLGKPFTDHMVIQRDSPIKIWGTAAPGEKVSVTFGSSVVKSKTETDGNWFVELQPRSANSAPQKITVKAGSDTLEIKDILIGDVYLCSGQSNMRWMLKQTKEGAEAVKNSVNPNLRVMNLASSIHPGDGKFSLLKLRNTFADNLYETKGWQVSGPETVPNFSGVAYYFGQYLQSKTNIPVGLIHNSVGGSPMEAWIPESGDRNRNWLETADLPKWVKGRAQLNLKKWEERPSSPTPHHPFEPGFLFQAGVRPFVDLPIKAVLWYQGESNATEDGAGSPAIDPAKNFKTHARLIDSWRTAFDKNDLPFYFVQLPGLNRDWSAFREAQSKIDLLIPNTHMAVTIDLGHPTNVHPTRKKPVGERLANLALKNEYGKSVVAEAPRLVGWVEDGENLRLKFDRPVKIELHTEVTIAGDNKVFKSIKLMTIRGEATDLIGYNRRLYPIKSIRYAWANDPKAKIVCAKSGLPVAPFRTDSWSLDYAAPQKEDTAATGTVTSFENIPPGEINQLEIDGLKLIAEPGNAEIDSAHAFTGKQCLHVLGGKDRQLEFRFPETISKGSILAFQAERWTKRSPFEFHLFGCLTSDEKWELIYDGSKEIKVGRAFLSNIRIKAPRDFNQLKMVSTSPNGSGVLIDDIQILDPKPMTVKEVTMRQSVHPVLLGKRHTKVLDIVVTVEGTIGDAPVMEELVLTCQGSDNRLMVDAAEVFYTGNSPVFSDKTRIGTRQEEVKSWWHIKTDQPLITGENHFQLCFQLKPEAPIDQKIKASCHTVKIDGKKIIVTGKYRASKRTGVALRQLGQNGVNSTRIPGLATTNEGTLIAVYDNRNRRRGDLPGDIDVGMSRSTNGGQTWEPMRVIMDMGNDPKWSFDGVGDPAVLVDRKTGTIWVAATWSHGERSWRGSGPGMEPEETGQFMLVKSDDDGETWSKPINITKQIKVPDWRFVLQGPGKGITMRDGTLVFPAQYRGENEKPVNGKPFSTLIYSKDRGETWKIGTGVKIDTTEAQLVELGDGSIMINCRDNRGGSRAIYTTTDLGKTWHEHPTSRKALPEPVCMATLIRVETQKYGPLLFFSNPAQTKGRKNMTIKVSNDEGETWPEKWHTLVDSGPSAYSCMTQVDGDQIGLLYETPGELVYVRYSIDELMEPK